MLVAVCGCFYVCANASNSQNATIEVDSVLRAMYASEPKFEDSEYKDEVFARCRNNGMLMQQKSPTNLAGLFYG